MMGVRAFISNESIKAIEKIPGLELEWEEDFLTIRHTEDNKKYEEYIQRVLALAKA